MVEMPRVSAYRDFLLECLSSEERRQLLLSADMRRVFRGEAIFHEGEAADFICIVRRGRVKLSHFDWEGRERILMILEEGDTIWESMFLERGTFPYSAIALTDTLALRITRERFAQILQNSTVSMGVITMLSRKLHAANRRNLILSTKDPSARLAGFLLYQRERSRSDTLSLRLSDIASSVGMREETVSRRLAEFRREGLVERLGNGKILLLTLEALEERFRAGEGEEKA